jgi:hypothetical protein
VEGGLSESFKSVPPSFKRRQASNLSGSDLVPKTPEQVSLEMVNFVLSIIFSNELNVR